jgi:hypothetical protein
MNNVDVEIHNLHRQHSLYPKLVKVLSKYDSVSPHANKFKNLLRTSNINELDDIIINYIDNLIQLTIDQEQLLLKKSVTRTIENITITEKFK